MTARPLSRRCFLLVELMIVIALGTGVIWILGKLLLDGQYLHRIAGQHQARVGTMDTLTDQLRDDALSTVTYEWQPSEQGGTLAVWHDRGRSASVARYAFETTQVTRTDASGLSDTWETERLRFAAQIEPGPCADVLQVDFIELPPRRAMSLPNRCFSISILLPRAGTTHKSESDDQP